MLELVDKGITLWRREFEVYDFVISDVFRDCRPSWKRGHFEEVNFLPDI